jgi:hypothetical protein
MLIKWSKYVSLLKTGVGSGDDCIDMTVVSIKGETKCWETKYDIEPEGLSDKDYTSSTTVVVENNELNDLLCKAYKGTWAYVLYVEASQSYEFPQHHSQWLVTCSQGDW